MYYSFGIEVFYGVKNLSHYDQNFLLGYTVIFMLLKEVSEGFSVDALHDNVDVFVIIDTLVKFDDIGMVHFKNHIDLLVEHCHHLIFIALIIIHLAFITEIVFVD